MIQVPVLTPEAESVLLALLYESSRGPSEVTRARLLARSELGARDFEACKAELEKQGLISRAGAGGEWFVLSPSGRDAAHKLGIVQQKGSEPEFSENLSLLQLAILNVVTEHELRFAGGAATRSQIRAAVRGSLEPKPDVESVNSAVDKLVGSHLETLGGVEASYRGTLRGLLASVWGVNALAIVGGVLTFLSGLKEADPSLFRYSWGSLRHACGLPMKALNLTYLAITRSNLGNGLFHTEGDYWWSTPPDLDLIVEIDSPIEYVRGVLNKESVTELAAVPRTEPNEPDEMGTLASTLLARVNAILAPNENPTVRLQEAFARLRLHPIIASASEKMFRDGHYRNAVLDAGIALIRYVREKSGRRDLDGADLMNQVFFPKSPVLAFNPRRTQSEKDEQQGLMLLFAGAVAAQRNPRAHALVPDSQEEALESIVLLSFLARRVDQAKRTRTKRPPKKD